MRVIILSLILSLGLSVTASAQQTALAKAKKLYNAGQYEEALPLFEAEYKTKKTNVSINHWYGVCLYETGGDIAEAEKLFKVASKGRIRDSFLYLGKIYTNQYKFKDAGEMYSSYEKHLKKRGDEKAKSELEELRKEHGRMKRIVSNTEDIQIIDSLVVDKNSFLDAYKISPSTGRLDFYNTVFNTAKPLTSTVYFNEKETKIYYAKPEKDTLNYTLYSMERLLKDFANEKKLSANNFGLSGNVNYPFLMADGVTIYFAAEDKANLGGYDLFVSRYNINNDTYLNPERLSAPFNSIYNDYMMVIDEEKGVGWFASDRFQDEGRICIYTFIPNSSVKIVESEDESYLAKRALITSIKDSWQKDASYKDVIARARKEVKAEKVVKYDFIFVLNDDINYYYISDFKSDAASNIFSSAKQMKELLEEKIEALENKRDKYSDASTLTRNELKSDILKLEKEINELRVQVKEKETLARNTELKHLNLDK